MKLSIPGKNLCVFGILLVLMFPLLPRTQAATVTCDEALGLKLSADNLSCDPIVSTLNTKLDVSSQADTQAELLVQLKKIVKWLQYSLLVAATILIVLAAFDYLFSKGDPEKVKAGQNALIYAIIAIVIAVIAGGIPAIVGKILGLS